MPSPDLPSPAPDPQPGKRVTIRDVAAVAGVHFTTVSLALRGSGQLPQATRERIQKVAEEMGYRPDPMLAALNVYRRAKRPPRYQATIAWINNWPQREALHANLGFREYYEGAKQRAEQIGYVLEEFWLREPGMTPERLTAILRARNIEAILLAPQPGPRIFPALDFTNFAALSFGYSLQPSIFHVVTNHHFHSMNLMLKRLMELGYRRIGFFGEQEWDEKVENSWIGGIALARWKYPQLEEVPPLLEKKTRDKDLSKWLKQHRPDVVVSYSGAAKWLRSLGCDIPGKMGFASLSTRKSEPEISGLYQNDWRIGQSAVDFIISMLHSGERGIPPVPTNILVESTWKPGQTLREQGS